MKKIYTLVLALIVSVTTFAQVDAYSEDVKQCIKSNGTYAYYENVVDQMFTMLQEQYASQNVPESVWVELKGLKTESLEELSQMVVSAYRGHFTHEDVKNMNALYATKAGQNMFKDASELTEGDKVALTEFYRSDTGQKITGSQDSMNDAMSKISEMWSSGFYRDIVDKLSEKGFNL
ncbi:DUF2059 domain-containing protein [Lacinutrix sp. C3R15]|uniref:DUF2059 domain-containing protein n=1 Tax=Flavobacteriaceae TaxID=49546 RepID=UPI001C08C72E|nr:MULTISPECIES: DUF2059 domain-containing protein [Flavobacteriaceae]MBU2939647.1 DUF2059 domain-containing protein [Lacinutrix sp. C3R15]MDO6622962.1 DUF2059 domain-containing protein [Oceanihabitans sp. 1_MG-2023]